MKASVFLILSILLIFLSGCSQPSYDSIINNRVSPNKWIVETINKLLASEDNDGGYSVLLDQRQMNLYETRYDVELLNYLNIKIPNSKKLKNELTETNLNIPSIKNATDLDTTLNFVLICKYMGVQLNSKYKEAIFNQITSLQNQDGLFEINDNSISSVIKVTQESIDILSELGYNTDNTDKLESAINIILRNNKFKTIYIWTIYDAIYNIKKNTNLLNNTFGGIFFKKLLSDNFNNVVNQKIDDMTQLINIYSYYDLSKELGKMLPLPKEISQYLVLNHLQDGGFSFFKNDNSDAQFTLQMYRLMSNETKINSKKLVSNIIAHQLPNGFFSARNDIKSNLNSSYMVLYIFYELGHPIPAKLKNYIMNYSLNNISETDLLILNQARIILNLSKIQIQQNKDHENIEHRDDLLYYLNSTNQVFKLENLLLNVIQNKKVFSLSNIDLISELTVNNKLDRLKELIIKLIPIEPHKDGGYGLKQNSDLIDTYRIIFAQSYLLNQIAYPNLILNYINKLKLPTGGYSFSVNNIISIEATFYGINCISLLNKN